MPLRWSCLHFGFAADYLQSRSSILVRTFRDQCRSTQDSLSSQEMTFLLVLAILDEGNAFDGYSFHPPGEQSSLCFNVPTIRELMAVEGHEPVKRKVSAVL